MRFKADTGQSNAGLFKGSEIEPGPPNGDGVAGLLTSLGARLIHRKFWLLGLSLSDRGVVGLFRPLVA